MAKSNPLARFDAYATLSKADLAALIPLAGQSKTFERGHRLHNEGDLGATLYLLLEGWTASSMSLPNGQRQILKVHLAGDLIGLPSLPLAEAPDTVFSLTPVVVSPISLTALGDIFKNSPRIAALLFLISQEERLMLMDRLAAVGRVEAQGRLAGYLLQLHNRLIRLNPNIGDVVENPLRQRHYSDLIGITEAHLSRIIREWRSKKLVEWKRDKVIIKDFAKLAEMAGLPSRKLVRDQPWLPPSK